MMQKSHLSLVSYMSNQFEFSFLKADFGSYTGFANVDRIIKKDTIKVTCGKFQLNAADYNLLILK